MGRLISDPVGISGLFHVSSDPISKYDLLCLLNEVYDADIEIIRDDSVEIDRSLDSSKFRRLTGFEPLPWPEMIRAMKADAEECNYLNV
jgi:dTDP-4-dehydrorhamnose reductase